MNVRSWQVGYRGLLPDGYLDGLRAEDRAGRYAFHLSGPAYPATAVAVEDGAIVGFVTSGPALDETTAAGAIQALYIHPRAWRRGIGQVLMTTARDRLVSLGFTDALLWVLVGNERAERFYRADGWRPDGRRRQEQVWGIWVDEICYRRRLP